MNEFTKNEGIIINGGDNKGNSFAAGKGAKAQSTFIANSTPDDVDEKKVSKGIKILLIFANPGDQKNLQLEREDRAIQEAIQLSTQRDAISLTVIHAASIHELRRAMLADDFQIIHFAGHGTPDGLILEDRMGRSYVVPPQPLADLFLSHRKALRCVVMNACYSTAHARLIEGVPYVIAMDGPVGDRAGLEFARGFYDAIGAGKTFKEAYEHASIAARLAAPGSRFACEIFVKDSL